MTGRGGRISTQIVFFHHVIGAQNGVGGSGRAGYLGGRGSRVSIATITVGLLAGVRHGASRDKEAGAGAGNGVPSIHDEVVRVFGGMRHSLGDFVTEVSGQVCVSRATRNRAGTSVSLAGMVVVLLGAVAVALVGISP